MAKRKVRRKFTVSGYIEWIRANYGDGIADDLAEEIAKKKKELGRDLFENEISVVYDGVRKEHDQYELEGLTESLNRKTNS